MQVLKFGAVWCGPCKTIEPYVKELEEKYKINVRRFYHESDQDIFEEFNIEALPTFILIFDDEEQAEELDRVEGCDREGIARLFKECVRHRKENE